MKKLLNNLTFIILTLNIFPIKPTNNWDRLGSYPYISGDTFRKIADFIFDETSMEVDPKKISSGDIIFVKTDYLNRFFEIIHPKIDIPYIIISHNSDDSAPGEFKAYLDDNKIIAWFGQNPSTVDHPKFFGIPIGIANKCWAHGNPEMFNLVLEELSTTKIEKDIFLYGNFNVDTNKAKRQPIKNLFINKNFCTYKENKSNIDYLRDVAHSKFILSPPGNGLDCHRTWEALLLGCIPIILSSNLNPILANLPVIIIEDWHDITEEFLNLEYDKINKKVYSLEQAWADYWINMIKNTKSKFLENNK